MYILIKRQCTVKHDTQIFKSFSTLKRNFINFQTDFITILTLSHWRVPKVVNSVFFSFNIKLILSTHWFNASRSKFNSSSISHNCGDEQQITVACIITRKNCSLDSKSLIYKINSAGSSILLCGISLNTFIFEYIPLQYKQLASYSTNSF